ncbi:protein PFC0760c-like [Belonocnema kinseyi]|uniref:protein PFC0760c-like n=1 Tax=Belonocnema kinseyi TaxID=2817044 RepID=UPI00143CC119|nr:protein PFC0760c-like [Belonocnema kinseyi]
MESFCYLTSASEEEDEDNEEDEGYENEINDDEENDNEDNLKEDNYNEENYDFKYDNENYPKNKFNYGNFNNDIDNKMKCTNEKHDTDNNQETENTTLQNDFENPEVIESVDNRPPPKPSPIEISLSSRFYPNKNIVEYRDKMSMRKDNYLYFTTIEGEPRDLGSSILEKRQHLPKFSKLRKGVAKEIRKVQSLEAARPSEAPGVSGQA